MKFRVALAPHVDRELEEHYRYIAREAPDGAVDWYNGCLEALASLGEFPERCPLAPESAGAGITIRHLLYGRYRILFLVRDGTVVVLHVRHGAMRPASAGAVGPFDLN